MKRLGTLLFLIALCIGFPALAYGSSPAEREAAVALGEEALKLFDEGRYADAYSRFAKANELLRAPTLMLFMARCQEHLGELLKAHELYEEVASMPLADDAPKQFVEAKTTAQAEKKELRQRLGAVRVRTAAARVETAELVVDGRPVARSRWTRGEIVLEPGEHTVVLEVPGKPPVQQEVTLQAGESAQELDLRLPSEPRPPPPKTPQGDEGALWPAGIALGLGAVGLGVGVITGVLALGEADDLKSRCIDNHCPVADAEQRDSAEVLATTSTVGFIVAGVGLAAGVVLVAWRPEIGSDSSEGSVALYVQPTGLGLKGAF